jgi:hypothetical protein
MDICLSSERRYGQVTGVRRDLACYVRTGVKKLSNE